MRKHALRAWRFFVGFAGAAIAFLIMDIPKTLLQIDASLVFILKSMGISQSPPLHLATTAWGNMIILGLLFIGMFTAFLFGSIAIEKLWKRPEAKKVVDAKHPTQNDDRGFGVSAMDNAKISIKSGSVSGNRGGGLQAVGNASISADDVRIDKNG